MTNYERWLLYTRDLESPEIYLRWGFISLIASALQRRVWMISNPKTQLPSESSIFSNLFNILIGPPATGKGRVIKAMASIIKHDSMKKVLPDGKLRPLINTSPDKIICERLIEKLTECQDSQSFEVEVPGGGKEKRAVAHNSCSFLIEELEVLYSKNAGDMVNVLNQFYDSGDLDYETKHHGKFHIKNICVNMLAGTTPESVRNLLTEKVIAGGHMSRLILVYADAPRFYRGARLLDVEQQNAYDELVKHVKLLATKVLGEVRLSKEAEEYFNHIYESGKMMKDRCNRDPRLDTYYGRKKMHWYKLAISLNYADQVESNTIGLPTMEEAYNDLNKTEVRMHEAFKNAGKNVIYETGVEVLRYVEESKEVRYKPLWFRFSRDFRKVEFDECLEYLLGTEQIENKNKQTNMLPEGIFGPGKKNGDYKGL